MCIIPKNMHIGVVFKPEVIKWQLKIGHMKIVLLYPEAALDSVVWLPWCALYLLGSRRLLYNLHHSAVTAALAELVMLCSHPGI